MSRLTLALKHPRGMVIIYAATLIALLGVLSTALLDGSAATIDAAQVLVFSHMARYAADSGIEYAIGCLESELSNACSPPGMSSPWCDAYYWSPTNGARPPAWIDWADPDSAAGNEMTKSLHSWVPSGTFGSVSTWNITPQVLATGNADEPMAARFSLSAFISMQAEGGATAPLSARRFDYRNVFLKVKIGQDAYFCIRSRGQVRAGQDPTRPPGDLLLVGNVNVVQKIRIGLPRWCNGQPRIERISYDILPGVRDRPTAQRGSWLEFPRATIVH